MPRTRKKVPLGSIEDPVEREKERKKRRKYRKQSWRRYSARRYKYIVKPKRLREQRRTKEEHGYYAIYITKRKKKERLVKHFRLKNKALAYFHNLVEENHSQVGFPKDYVKYNGNTEIRKLDMEVILVRRTTKDDLLTDTAFKDMWGGVITANVKGNREYIILERDDWHVEETFYCYGYHPVRDQKDYHFIWDNWIINGGVSYDNTRRITRFKNKLIIKDVEDFNFIVCRNEEQCEKLYFKLMSDCEEKKMNNLFFMGEVPSGLTRETYNLLAEKTGWERSLLYKTKI